jgi:hypothetical protein
VWFQASGYFFLNFAGHVIKVFERQDIVFGRDVEAFAYLYKVRMAVQKSHTVVTGLNVPLLGVWCYRLPFIGPVVVSNQQ